jgi:hypothetical protein
MNWIETENSWINIENIEYISKDKKWDVPTYDSCYKISICGKEMSISDEVYNNLITYIKSNWRDQQINSILE